MNAVTGYAGNLSPSAAITIAYDNTTPSGGNALIHAGLQFAGRDPLVETRLVAVGAMSPISFAAADVAGAVKLIITVHTSNPDGEGTITVHHAGPDWTKRIKDDDFIGFTVS